MAGGRESSPCFNFLFLEKSFVIFFCLYFLACFSWFWGVCPCVCLILLFFSCVHFLSFLRTVNWLIYTLFIQLKVHILMRVGVVTFVCFWGRVWVRGVGFVTLPSATGLCEVFFPVGLGVVLFLVLVGEVILCARQPVHGWWVVSLSFKLCCPGPEYLCCAEWVTLNLCGCFLFFKFSSALLLFWLSVWVGYVFV